MDNRRAILDSVAVQIGRKLFLHQRDMLVGEGRSVVGGWPGTKREARAVVVSVLGPTLAERRMAAPTLDELTSVMHAAYGEARRTWLSSHDRRGDSET
jgi:hypothetical protein